MVPFEPAPHAGGRRRAQPPSSWMRAPGQEGAACPLGFLHSALPANPMDEKRRRKTVARTVRHLLEKYRRAGGDGARIPEAGTKKDYILPLFRSLGWDIEDGEEVTAEERISRGFVDYGFRADNLPMFYLEAKGMNIQNMEQSKWISQAVNYSWLKAVPWAVLTNFRVLKVLNAEARVSTPASVQFFEIKCDDMLDPQALDKLLLLSRESLVGGALDRAAREWGAIGPTMPVDRRLYEDLFKAREMLTRSIIRNNTGLPKADREESVERMLSRLVFVRALEDRGLSEPILMPLVREAEERPAAGAGRGGRRDVTIRDGLRKAFRRLDDAYNASLFALHPCDRLDITDYALTRVISMLHTSAEQLQRYDFSVLDVDVLGGIYEQYLGAIAAGRAAGGKGGGGTAYRQSHGIYYTPSSIVGFMVDVLVRYLVEGGQDPDTMRVCDPSCGSGTFLVRCVRAIAGARCEKAAGGGPGGPLGAPHGAMLRRMTVRSIEENVFGVDLDRTAVERARLNLFLCEVGRDKRLPNVHETVRLGNSLMDTGVPPSVEANPFPWDRRFSGEFDGMIGNPPYIRNRRMSPEAKAWFAGEYASASGQYDAYVLFVERALAKVRDGGCVVFITSNKYAAAAYGAALRRHILETARIRMIVDVSDTRVFPEPDVYPWIVVLQKEPRPEKRRANIMLVGRAGSGGGAASPYACRFARIPQSAFEDNPGNVFYVDAPERGRGRSGGGAGSGAKRDDVGEAGDGGGAAVGSRASKMVLDMLDRKDGTTIPMGSFTIRESVHTGNVRKKLVLREAGEGPALRKVIRGKDMGRYCHEWDGYWLDTGYEPADGEYMRINEPDLFRGKKIFLRDIANRITACYDDSGLYSLNTLFVVRTDRGAGGAPYDPLYVLAVLNSSLMSWYFAKRFGAVHVAGGYMRYKKQYVEQLPIRAVPPKKQAPIAEAVREMHRLVKKRSGMAGSEGTDRWREVDESIRRQDEAIDVMIFGLYGIDAATAGAIRRDVPDAAVRIGAARRARGGRAGGR